MRALSPHHVYYGIFENGAQQRGYITVYEAWAATLNEDGDANSERFPALCLETINVPMRVFDAVQQDLLVILEAVATSRVLADGLVLITSLGTWNFQNGEVLRQSRRARQGKPVRLFPADPAGWNVYQRLAPEAEHYTAFFDDSTAWPCIRQQHPDCGGTKKRIFVYIDIIFITCTKIFFLVKIIE